MSKRPLRGMIMKNRLRNPGLEKGSHDIQQEDTS